MTDGPGVNRVRASGGRRRLGRSRWLVCGFLLAVVACSDATSPAEDGVGTTVGAGTDAPVATEPEAADERNAEADPQPGPEAVDEQVGLLPGGRVVEPDLETHRVELTVLADDPLVAAAVYPRPDREGNPWSQWGQGIVVDDGRVVTAIGDHLGADGNSYLYVYDPQASTLARFADVLSALDHRPGGWGYGKIHSQMVDPGGDSVYFTTYWGTRRGLVYDEGYGGDVLFRLDKSTLALQPVAIPAPERGIPSLASNGAGLIYGEIVDPLVSDDLFPSGGFVVYDVTSGQVVRTAEDPVHDGFRNILVDEQGSAWFARDGGQLLRYDPAADETSEVDVDLGGMLRASTRPTADGTVFAVTQDPDRFLAIDPAGPVVRPLGEALGYTASIALLPDESGFLYVPGAHGRSATWGTPLIRVDGETGEQTVVVELADLLVDELGVTPGGTYSIVVDAEREVASVSLNAGTDPEEPWGEVVFVVVDLS